MAFRFLISEGFRGLVRSKFSSFITIVTISIALIFIGTGYLIGRDVLSTVQKVKSSFDMEVFLIQSATDTEIDSLRNLLGKMDELESFTFISREEAAKRFKHEFGEDIFDILGVNPLPASFNLKFGKNYRTVTSMESLKTKLESIDIVDEVKYRKSFILVLQRYLNLTVLIGGIFAGLILLSAFFLISNTIKLSIFAKSSIISTLKLLGASDIFVKTPFWLEGALQGFIAACIADLIIFGGVVAYNFFLTETLDYTIRITSRFFVAIIVVGVFLGWMGSRRAIRKFLKM